MQYLLNVWQPGDGTPAPPAQLEPIIENVTALNAEMKEAGVWVFGAGLHGPGASTVLRAAGGETLTTDGPYAEASEHIGGFTIIEAPDLDAALAWGAKLARATTLAIEVRPFRH